MFRKARPLTLVLVLAIAGVAEAKRPDVRATAISPVGYAHPGGAVGVTLTVKRTGTKKALGVRAYLSADAKRSKDDTRLGATRIKGTIASLSGKIPAATKARYVVACADDPARLRERNERNNCKATAVTVLAEADASKTSQALIAADLA